MPSKNVKNVLKQFRTRFQGKEADLPMSLRQESNEIIYTALLEDDESPMPPPTPMLGFSPDAGDIAPPIGAEGSMVDELMRASVDAEAPIEGQGPPALPMAPGGAPGAAPAPQQGAPAGGNPLDDLMGLL